jgi:hypothetical protein
MRRDSEEITVFQHSGTPTPRSPGVQDVDDDEYSLPDEALAFTVGSAVAERSREKD